MTRPIDATGSALLARALAHSHADEPRLVYADWCDEAGHPDMALRIRLQVAAARPGQPNAGAIAAAQRELSTQTIDPLLARALGTFRVAVEYRRGLAWRIELRSTHVRKRGRWGAAVAELVRHYPTIERAAFLAARDEPAVTGEEIAEQLAGWSRLHGAVFRCQRLSARALGLLAALTELRALDFDMGPDDHAWEALSRLGQVEHLRIEHTGDLLPGPRVGEVLPWRTLAGLRTLHLQGFRSDSWAPLAGLERLERLAMAPPESHAASIARLPLRAIDLVAQAMPVRADAVAAFPALPALEHLGLHGASRTRGPWTRELARFPALASLAVGPADEELGLGVRMARYAPGLVRFATTARVTSGLVADLTTLPRLAALRLVSRYWDEGAVVRIGLLAGRPRSIELGAQALDDDRLGRVLAGIGVASLAVSGDGTLRTLTEARLRMIAGPTLEHLVLRGRWRVNATGRLLGRYLPRLRLLWADEMPEDQMRAVGQVENLGVAVGNPLRWGARIAQPTWCGWAPLASDLPEELWLNGQPAPR